MFGISCVGCSLEVVWWGVLGLDSRAARGTAEVPQRLSPQRRACERFISEPG